MSCLRCPKITCPTPQVDRQTRFATVSKGLRFPYLDPGGAVDDELTPGYLTQDRGNTNDPMVYTAYTWQKRRDTATFNPDGSWGGNSIYDYIVPVGTGPSSSSFRRNTITSLDDLGVETGCTDGPPFDPGGSFSIPFVWVPTANDGWDVQSLVVVEREDEEDRRGSPISPLHCADAPWPVATIEYFDFARNREVYKKELSDEYTRPDLADDLATAVDAAAWVNDQAGEAGESSTWPLRGDFPAVWPDHDNTSTAESAVATAQQRDCRYRWSAPVTHAGSWYRVLWDEVFFPDSEAAPTVVAKTWEWNGIRDGLGNPEPGEWIQPDTPSEPGHFAQRNVRYACFRAAWGTPYFKLPGMGSYPE